MTMDLAPLFARIEEADRGIRPQVLETPLDRSRALSDELGMDVWLKADHLQPVGTFKLRGATNKIRTLSDAERARGVITASTGNHGLGAARAGALAGCPVTVYVVPAAPAEKLTAIRSYGAELVFVEGAPLDAEIEARRQAELQGKAYVAPYNDVETMAGQGTLGMEIARQTPDLDAVFVCVGGGGLVGGVGAALKTLSPSTRVVGVWPEASTCMRDSILAGEIVATPESETLSEASTGAVEPGSVTFPVCAAVIDEMLTVSEVEIARAMRRIASGERWMVEGAAGVAVAGMIQAAERYRGQKVAAILCGRNIAIDLFLQAMRMAEG
jgi:threonine dehydratase